MLCPHALKHRPELGQWQADDPTLVAALLRQGPELGVRPPGQLLPAHLQGSLLGRQFRCWLRQRDDAQRAVPKAALTRALAALPGAELARHARQQACLALAGGWNHWIWAAPVASIASLLGLALPDLAAQQQLHRQMQALAAALAPAATPAQLDAADRACGELLQALRAADTAAPLQACLAHHAPAALWRDHEDFEANRLALLWQSYEAGAALLGQALIRLGQQGQPYAPRRPQALPDWLAQLVSEGGAVRNTRRFAQRALQAGPPAGACLLLDLSGGLGFGAGAHRCPGQDLALGSAAAALALLLDDDDDEAAEPRPPWPQRWQILTLPNMHIPVFDTEEPPNDCRDL